MVKLTIDRYVWSTRDQWAIPRLTRWPLLGNFVIVKRHDAKLGAGLELEHLRFAVERHLLAVDLIGAVLARRLDRHRVCAGFDEITGLVLAVPFERVFARRPRGGAEGAHDRRVLRHAAQTVGA